SYGGYLSLLIAKIAPWYVDGVIDNSGPALPPLKFILGREFGFPEFVFSSKDLDLYCFLKKYWTRKENALYFFNDVNYMIRALLNLKHLQILSEVSKNIIFITYHSTKDVGAPAKDKIMLYEIFNTLGFDATLNLIKDENEVDGRFIKDLNHGMRITDRALFRKELPLMLEKLQKRKSFMRENSISYPCGDKIFTFKDKENQFILENF
ncbi:DUF2920 family protein, partial [Campylobacter jejuni]